MDNSLMIERIKFVKGLNPVADAFAGTVQSEAVNMGKYLRVAFIIVKGVGTTGTSTVTIQASSDASQTGATAIPFYYRRIATGDTGGAVTEALAAGFNTTAGSDERYVIEVAADACPTDKPFINMKLVEVVDSPVLGGIEILAEGKYYGNVLPTAIV